MAVIARKGSDLVKEIRQKKEQNKSRTRFWELAGDHPSAHQAARMHAFPPSGSSCLGPKAVAACSAPLCRTQQPLLRHP